MSDYDDDSVMRGMRDIDAMSREHSHVSAETFNRLSAIARSAAHPVKSSTIAARAVKELDSSELEEILADWLEGRGYTGSF